MTFREGQRVAYVGDGDHDLLPGDRGKVASAERDASHVLWTTGAQAGNIIFHSNFDLISEGKGSRPTTVDSLDGPLVSVAVRDTFERFGSTGLLNALNDEGHLSAFSGIAEEALEMVATKVRQEPAFREVLAQLEPEEGDEVVILASLALLRDAFGEEDA